jgi:RNA-directed DNA polymerase
VNIGAPWPTLLEAKARVLGMQTKLHQWASADESRRFDDLFNLVHDPAFLTVAWSRVRGNKGARSAGVDGQTARYIEQQRGTAAFLNALRADLKARTFEPLPVRERMIPKPGGKQRRLGIPTIRDRVVQASLKLVLEPIFEADFKPCSYGFRPGRRPTTPSLRCTCSPAAATSGCWRQTSRRASTTSTTPPSWAGCVDVSETSASWRWSRRS